MLFPRCIISGLARPRIAPIWAGRRFECLIVFQTASPLLTFANIAIARIMRFKAHTARLRVLGCRVAGLSAFAPVEALGAFLVYFSLL